MRIQPPVLIVVIFAVGGFAQIPSYRQTPAEQSILFAKSELKKNPSKSSAYTELAIAFLRRARETSDDALYDQAEAAVQKSLILSPNNFEARKAHVTVLLARHNGVEARAEAQKLNQEVPDDVIVYGYIADANVELGDYDEAEKAAQWMLDLRPHNIPGLLRGAHLRKVFGDLDGAIEFLNDAYQQTPPDQIEDLAFILTEMAALDLAMGKVTTANQLADQALKSFPDYYLALESMAQVRSAQGRYAEAAELLRKRNARFSQLGSLYRLAEALERAGKTEEAKPVYSEFEERARLEASQGGYPNRELVFLYVDHRHDPANALLIARLAMKKRHDVSTLDAYAWALYANGDYAEARKQIDKAMAPGVRDASIFFHAAMISSKLNDRQEAKRYLESSLQLNPVSEIASDARERLAKSSRDGDSKQ